MATRIEDVLKRFERIANRQRCPDCGAFMELVDWENKNGTLFIWYSCNKEECDSQWLKTMDSYEPDKIEKIE